MSKTGGSVGEMRSVSKVLVGKHQRKDYLKDVEGVDERIILK
jgi:hypothetical protein